jgi:hypothetical protein
MGRWVTSKGAQNVGSILDLKIFFKEFRDCGARVVFHCEFSPNRGPALMRSFRRS